VTRLHIIGSIKGLDKRRAVAFCFVVVAALLFIYSCSSKPQATNVAAEISPQQTPAAEDPAGDPNLDYSKFLHTNPTHERMPCLICHQRNDNATRISFPGTGGHSPCIGCHQQQFSAGRSSPICTICHTDAQTGALKAFPPLESFNANFSHASHHGVTCATCHKPAQAGVARSIPDRSNAHMTCFQCHTAESDVQKMSSCNVCHKPGEVSRTPETARAFQMSFSHSRHSRAGLSCASCHNTSGRNATAPVPKMHHAPAGVTSCASCHNGKRAFGADDFTNCKRCHVGNSFKF
jgi:c(7)-type cytochrome triheme protein